MIERVIISSFVKNPGFTIPKQYIRLKIELGDECEFITINIEEATTIISRTIDELEDMFFENILKTSA